MVKGIGKKVGRRNLPRLWQFVKGCHLEFSMVVIWYATGKKQKQAKRGVLFATSLVGAFFRVSRKIASCHLFLSTVISLTYQLPSLSRQWECCRQQWLDWWWRPIWQGWPESTCKRGRYPFFTCFWHLSRETKGENKIYGAKPVPNGRGLNPFHGFGGQSSQAKFQMCFTDQTLKPGLVWTLLDNWQKPHRVQAQFFSCRSGGVILQVDQGAAMPRMGLNHFNDWQRHVLLDLVGKPYLILFICIYGSKCKRKWNPHTFIYMGPTSVNEVVVKKNVSCTIGKVQPVHRSNPLFQVLGWNDMFRWEGLRSQQGWNEMFSWEGLGNSTKHVS